MLSSVTPYSIPQVTCFFSVFTQTFGKYSGQYSQCDIPVCAVHDGKVGYNTVKYTMAFQRSKLRPFWSPWRVEKFLATKILAKVG